MSYFWGIGGCCCPHQQHYTIRKFDADGNIKWERDYGQGASLYCLSVDVDDNIYVGGDWDPTHYYTVHKYDSDGDLLYPIATGFPTYGVASDDDGNLYATGRRIDGITTKKILADGTEAFSLDWGDETYCIAVKENNFYVGGKQVLGDAVDGSAYSSLAKYDLDGSQIWSANIGASGIVYAIRLDDDDNVIINCNGPKGEIDKIEITGGTPTSGSFQLLFQGTPVTIPYNATAAAVAAAIETQLPSPSDSAAASGGPLPGTPVVLSFSLNVKQFPTNLSIGTNSLVGGGTPAVTCLVRGKQVGGVSLGAAGVAKLDSDGNLLWTARQENPQGVAIDFAGNVYRGANNTKFSKLSGDGALIYDGNGGAFSGFLSAGVAVDSTGSVYTASGQFFSGGGYVRKWSPSIPPSLLWSIQWSDYSVTNPRRNFLYAANAITLDSEENIIVVGIRNPQ